MLFLTRLGNRTLRLLAGCVCLTVASATSQHSQPTGSGRLLPGDQKTSENPQPSKQEIGQAYRKWLDQDVRWIISDEERKAFRQLSSDQERDHFIEAFWRRRDPTPDTMENEYREEHYRRIVFANEEFGSFIPGWKTHRGRLYIMYGPPAEIETHASGGTYTPSGGPTISNLPYVVWHYRYIEGLGKDVAFSFADICKCGDYELSGGESYYVAGNLLSVNRDRNLGWPRVRFKDLEEVVSHKVDIRLVPFTVRTDFVRATDFTVDRKSVV